MSDTERSDVVHCPECGALVGAGVQKCWLCGASLADLDDVVMAEIVLPHLPHREASRFSYSLGLLITVVTLICVSLGLVSIAPGLGIAFAIFVTPAYIRTAVGVARRNVKGQPMDIGQKILAFGGSLAVMTVIAVAAAVAFFATCFAGFWAAAPVFVYVASAETIVWVLVIAIVIGSIAAGVVGYLLIRRLWPRMD